MKKNKLYIVICIDTEGPAGYALNSWPEVDEMMRLVTSKNFRNQFPDSKGNPAKLNFFIMDWSGFRENPAKRDLGYGRILDYYLKNILINLPTDDYFIGWHYHHPYKDGSWQNGGWNKNWKDNNEYEEQINRLIFEKNIYPAVYRAGGTIETNEQSLWLNNWIPFDYSSRSPEPSLKFYLANLKNILKFRFKKPLWSWTKAPKKWHFYHPSENNYQKCGKMKRSILRCLDIDSAAHKLTKSDIKKAFQEAQDSGQALCSFFTHDFYKTADKEIASALLMIKDIAKQYPDVDFTYETALTAAQKLIYPDNKPDKLEIKATYSDNLLNIESNQSIFSPQPWVVIKTKNNKYARIDTNRISETRWELKLNPQEAAIAIAACDILGNYCITKLEI